MNEPRETVRDASRHRAGGRGGCGVGRDARLGVAAALLLALGAVAGAVLTLAVDVSAHGGGWRAGGHHPPASIEEARERALDGAAWALGTVDATPAQRERVNAVVADLVEALYPLRDEHRANRRRLIGELARPTLDHAAIDAIRRAELALADEASAQLVDAVVEVSRVLDPEQRQVLVQRVGRLRR